MQGLRAAADSNDNENGNDNTGLRPAALILFFGGLKSKWMDE